MPNGRALGSVMGVKDRFLLFSRSRSLSRLSRSLGSSPLSALSRLSRDRDLSLRFLSRSRSPLSRSLSLSRSLGSRSRRSRRSRERERERERCLLFLKKNTNNIRINNSTRLINLI